MKSVSFYTLGCKLNQSETAAIADNFRKNGYKIVEFGQRSDVCFINTCSVTERSDYKCRQIVRRAIQKFPRTFTIVAGCYPQLNPEAFTHIKGVDLILGNAEKFAALDYLGEGQKLDRPKVLVAKEKINHHFFTPAGYNFWKHTRAFLKIQDGCNNHCSYCVVPKARGKSRSGNPTDLLRQSEELIRRGYKEIVLTGVHIGAYGLDLKGNIDLVGLLKNLLEIDGLGRIRLSSIDPEEINDELIALMVESGKLCRHLHVPLQSGDNGILCRMNRNYDSSYFEGLVYRVVESIPEIAIGSDVIVGFPGEDEKKFENTYSLIERLPLSYLHVFSYSAREGTAAAKFPNQVDPRIKKERSSKLRALGEVKRRKFYHKFLETTLEVLPEETSLNESLCGLSDNYVRVHINSVAKEYINQIIPVNIIGLRNGKVLGELATEKLNKYRYDRVD